MMNKKIFFIGALLLAASALSGNAAPLLPAQIDEAAREAERIQREQRGRVEQEWREEAQKRPRTVIELEEARPAPAADGGACRDIKEVLIEGATLLADRVRQELVAPYLGKCLTVSDIEHLLGDITKHYIDQGFIAVRAYVQTQDLSNGVLRILVVEGAVEKLQLQDGGNRNINLSTAFPGVEGKPLNLRDIEQGLDQVNRLASNSATMDIKPGERAGGSIVQIRNQPKERLRGNVTYDNFGSSSTGEAQLGASVSVDNPFGLNDSLNATHRRSTQGDFKRMHSRSNSFLYSIPFGYFTLTGAYTWSDYVTTISPPGGDVMSNGYSELASIAGEYVAYRDKVNRVAITGTLAAKKSENYLAGQLLGVSSRTLSSFDLGVGWNTQFLGGVLGLNVDHVFGISMFNALKDPSGLPEFAPRAQFRKWTMGANWMRPFQIGAQNFTYSATASAQHGATVLYGSEQFSIGSLYSVRGYRNTSITGDSGYYWRNDLAAPFPALLAEMPMTIKPYIAYDIGGIRDRFAEVGGHLTGMAIGISASAARFSADISGVKPLTMPGRLKDEGFQWYAKLNINF